MEQLWFGLLAPRSVYVPAEGDSIEPVEPPPPPGYGHAYIGFMTNYSGHQMPNFGTSKYVLYKIALLQK